MHVNSYSTSGVSYKRPAAADTKLFDVPADWDWIHKEERRKSIEVRCVRTSTGCLVLNTCLSSTGYATVEIKANGKRQMWFAHRLMWVLVKGRIPDGMYICHKCDVRNCVEPEHLWLGTAQDNSDDAVSKRRTTAGRQLKKT